MPLQKLGILGIQPHQKLGLYLGINKINQSINKQLSHDDYSFILFQGF